MISNRLYYHIHGFCAAAMPLPDGLCTNFSANHERTDLRAIDLIRKMVFNYVAGGHFIFASPACLQICSGRAEIENV